MTRTQQDSFRSKAEREQETDLIAKYRELGNPHIRAAVSLKPKSPTGAQPQMQMGLDDEND